MYGKDAHYMIMPPLCIVLLLIRSWAGGCRLQLPFLETVNIALVGLYAEIEGDTDLQAVYTRYLYTYMCVCIHKCIFTSCTGVDNVRA